MADTTARIARIQAGVICALHGVAKGMKHCPRCRLIEAAPQLLELAQKYASECGECNGTGVVHRTIGGDGYGDRCAGLADVEAVCPDCEEIRFVIRKATAEAL